MSELARLGLLDPRLKKADPNAIPGKQYYYGNMYEGPAIQPTPRNQVLGLLADAANYTIPKAISSVPNLLNEMSYGEMPYTGTGLTTTVDPRVVDFADFMPGKAALTGVGLLGTFVGKGSKLWKKADYNKALKLEKEGATPEQIWQETGTAKFADGKWRQEISDVGSKITDDVYEEIVANQQYKGLLSDALEHPNLFKAYPDIGDVKTNLYASKNTQGSYMPDIRTITAGAKTTGRQKSAVLHEIAHDIQEAENFARGGNPDQIITTFEDLARQKREEAKKLLDLDEAFGSLSKEQLGSRADEVYSAKDKALKLEEQAKVFDNKAKEAYLDSDKKFKMYEKMAGEAEARLTQTRMNLTDAERRANFPYSYGTEYGLDYPMEELFVQGILK